MDLLCWLKASFSTVGRGVRYVTSPGQAARAYDELAAAGQVLAQQPAAARVSTDRPQPRADIEERGRHLGWHGGLTLGYLHRNGLQGSGEVLTPCPKTRCR